MTTTSPKTHGDFKNPKTASGASHAVPVISRTVISPLLNRVLRGTRANPIQTTPAQATRTRSTYPTVETRSPSHVRRCCGGTGQAHQARQTAANKPAQAGIHSAADREAKPLIFSAAFTQQHSSAFCNRHRQAWLGS
jgi:hypothetical protein